MHVRGTSGAILSGLKCRAVSGSAGYAQNSGARSEPAVDRWPLPPTPDSPHSDPPPGPYYPGPGASATAAGLEIILAQHHARPKRHQQHAHRTASEGGPAGAPRSPNRRDPVTRKFFHPGRLATTGSPGRAGRAWRRAQPPRSSRVARPPPHAGHFTLGHVGGRQLHALEASWMAHLMS